MWYFGTGGGLYVWVPSCNVIPARPTCSLLPQPVHWEYDRALWLHPLPHALLLADSAKAAQVDFEGCCCLNSVCDHCEIVCRLYAEPFARPISHASSCHPLTQGSLLDGTFSRLWPVSLRGEVVQCGADSAP